MKFIILFFIMLSFFSCRKDNYSKLDLGFTKSFDFGQNDKAHKVILINNELYVFGSIEVNGINNMNLLKIDTLGNKISNSILSSNSNEFGTDFILSSDNTLILIGSTQNSSSNDIVIKKVTLDGTVIWSTILGGTENESASGIIEVENGDFCISATTRSYGSGNNDLYLIWINQNGEIIREKTYGGNQSDGSTAILKSNTNLIILGYTNSWGSGGQDYFLLKINSIGDSIWSNTYGGADYEESQGLVKSNNGGFIINGHSNSTDPIHDMYAVGVNSTGDLLWENNFGGALHDGGQTILKNSDNDYLLIGRSMSFGNGQRDVYITTITETGLTISETSITTATFDWINSAIELNGYYYLVGHTSESNMSESNILVLKIKR